MGQAGRRDTAGRRRSSAEIAIGFGPWIVYGVMAGAGFRGAAALLALAVAALLVLRRARRGRVRLLEGVALGSFAVAAVDAVSGGLLFRNVPVAALASGTLAAAAWASLAARRPFTSAYAREDWPPEYWSSPVFVRINLGLTTVWATVFTLNTALVLLAAPRPGARAWLSVVLPQALIVVGAALSIVAPRWYARRWAAREIAQREPYHWPAPVFHRRDDGYDVAVVGAGIGGLTAAALLADRGLRVIVFEQHSLPGGFCTSWPRVVRRGEERSRYVFDAGVHDVSGLGPRGPVRHLLAHLGLDDRMEWRRMEHEYVWPDLRLRVPHRAADFVALLGDRFPAERSGLGAFFAEMEAVYREMYADVERTGGVPVPPRTVDEALAYPAQHPHAFRWMNVPFTAMVDAYVSDPRLKRLLSALTGYLTDRPEALTVGAMAPIFGYYFDGGYYPAGGSQTLADALAAVVVSRGGTVALRTPVRRILVDSGRAVGVETAEGRRYRTTAVVSNADVRRTFVELVGLAHLPDDFAAQLAGVTPSASALMVFLGVDDVPDVAPITIMDGGETRLQIVVTSKVDPSLAPPGHSAVTLVTLVPPDRAAGWDRTAPGYVARRRAACDALVVAAERVLPGLRDHIVYRQDASPATFARYAWTTNGSIYGPALGAWRPPAKSPIDGLVLAGSGVFPGAGVEAVVISGVLAADALCAGRYPGGRAQRKRDGEGSTPSLAGAIGDHRPPVPLHHLADDGQAEARAAVLTTGLAPTEATEHVEQEIGADPDPGGSH